MHSETAAVRCVNADGIPPVLSRPGAGREARDANLGSRVLVVDDCEPLRYLKSQYLLDAGFQVSQADTGNAALRSIEGERPDLLLLDVNLPDIHGSEVCREVKARWGLPVVYTSSVDIPDELHGTADGWVVSVDEADLLDAVRRALDCGSRPKRRPDESASRGNTRVARRRRSPALEIAEQVRRCDAGLLREALDASAAILFVLNESREIVFCNRAALRLAGAASLSAMLGLQMGEALGCVHATPEGCGAADFCRTCGALPSLEPGGVTKSREYHFVRSINGLEEACDLTVSTSPIAGRDEFVVCTVADISHEKRRQAVERHFFHDILNLAGGVKGLAALLRDELEDGTNAELATMAAQAASELIAEIHSGRLLVEAEAGLLETKPTTASALELVQTAAAEYRGHLGSQQRTILVDPASGDLRMETDREILLCVLGNMLKNAIEAAGPGGTVTIGCQAAEDGVEFWVHDPCVIPRETQLQVFPRSFSATGRSRDVRTYSMKLLTERYLGGTVRFESDALQGTRFIARYPTALDHATGDAEQSSSEC